MAFKLFVGGISWDTTSDSLKQFFEQAGEVTSADVITDRYTGRSRGFAFVEMTDEEGAEKARKLNGQELDGRAITVDDAKPQKESNFKGGDSRGGGSRDEGSREDRRFN